MKKYIIALLMIGVLVGCSDDDGSSLPATQLLDAVDIKIVNLNGSDLEDLNCIDPTGNYAVRITVAAQDATIEIAPTSIDFTVNGVVSNVTFTEAGSKIVPVALVEGENSIQIVTTGMTTTTYIIAPPQFEIVM